MSLSVGSARSTARARAQTDRIVSEAAYFELVRTNVVEWSAAERAKIAPAVDALSAKLTAFSLDFSRHHRPHPDDRPRRRR